MKSLVLVGLGGFCGAICRYLIAVGMSRLLTAPVIPFGTLLANVLGCMIAGMLLETLARESQGGLFLLVGFLGSLTTFSSFSVETLSLFKTRSILLSAGYAAITLLACLAAAGFGMWLMKSMKAA
jgi:CrcB protein